MRNFKIFLWIFVIFLVQTVVLSPIHIFGAVPSAVLAFVMCVAILENEFRTAVIISGICGRNRRKKFYGDYVVLCVQFDNRIRGKKTSEICR